MLKQAVGGPHVVTKGGGYVQGWPIAFDMCCCMGTIMLHRGHVTWLMFTRRTLYTLGVGVGAKGGALGCVAGGLWQAGGDA